MTSSVSMVRASGASRVSSVSASCPSTSALHDESVVDHVRVASIETKLLVSDAVSQLQFVSAQHHVHVQFEFVHRIHLIPLNPLIPYSTSVADFTPGLSDFRCPHKPRKPHDVVLFATYHFGSIDVFVFACTVQLCVA
eukprot:CAMPEP_0116902358 /NCGR_PEP_ID=MMETSP0467-20121206/9976_1 /TAXON_ID=283647 /ORGANISM="Mesodinium pulex, Strain SPMC105" /LENGTH=137 /DNA_ID=CAMNT_0004576197 /DNA_START=762 /DNA_END=1175 /DNA_ORIENTATION=-